MQLLISFLKCTIKFIVSSTNIVLLQFQKNNSKTEKTYYFINGDFDQKSAWNKKDVKCNSLSDMFYQISCIFNLYGFIIIPFLSVFCLFCYISSKCPNYTRDLKVKNDQNDVIDKIQT